MIKTFLTGILFLVLLFFALAQRSSNEIRGEPTLADEFGMTEQPSSEESPVVLSSTLKGNGQKRPAGLPRISVAVDNLTDIVQVLNEELSSGSLTEDQFLLELESWRYLCERVFHPDLRPWLPDTEVPASFREELNGLCSGFTPDLLVSLDQLDNEEFESSLTTAEETHLARPLTQLIAAGDRNAARDLLLGEIHKAMAEGRSAQATSALWEIHTHNLLEELPGAPLASAMPSVEYVVPSAVATVLVCQRIGGCRPNHPLIIQFCLYYPDRSCQPPVGVYDAIDQVLTGYEIEYFNHMLEQVEAGLRRVRHD